MAEQKILFIGGWTRDKNSYRKLFESAKDGYEAIFMPCHEALNGSSMEESADAVRKFLQDNKIEKAMIAGHSLGGTVAIEFALKYPELTEELVLVDSGGLLVKQSMMEKTKNIINDQVKHFSRKTKANITFGLRFARRPVQSIQSLTLAYYHDLSERMSEITTKTLVLWGGADHVYPVEQGREINRLIKNSRLIIIPEMDHDWIIHSPEYFWKELP